MKKFILTLIIFLGITGITQARTIIGYPFAYSSDLPTSGLVGWWTFDVDKVNWSTNTATDSSGSGNNGTIVNMATSTATEAGIIGQGLKFSGGSLSSGVFGNQISNGNGSTGRPVCAHFTAPADGSITNISFYAAYAAGGGHWVGGVYDSDGTGGRPSTLLGQSTVNTTFPTSADWSTSTMDSSISITSGHEYWLCNHPDVNSTYYYFDGGISNSGALLELGTYPTYPNPGVVNSFSTRQLKIYATYTSGTTGPYVNVGTSYNGVKSLSFWIKPNSTTQSVIDLNGSAYISFSSGTISATGFTSPTIYVDGIVSSTVSNTGWHLITITTATGINANALNLGLVGSTNYKGILDDVRIYNRVLSTTEVSTLYYQSAFRRSILRSTGKWILNSSL